MHIGCCENCRYLDLYETVTKGCPRCGGHMVSLGIGSAHWNSMSEEERAGIISEKVPTIEELFAQPVKGHETEAEEPEPESITESEFVYVCYKCNTIAAHDGSQENYYCPECGSDMVAVGYSTDQWADLTKEEKRKIAEEAKISHMVSAIKEASYEENEGVSTPNIINVVKS